MTSLPDESWYGFSGASPTETPLPYSQTATRNTPRSLWRRLKRTLGRLPYVDLKHENQSGQFWLWAALLLLFVGIVSGSDFFLVAGMGILIFVALAWVWDALSLLGVRYSRHFRLAGTDLGQAGAVRAFLGETVEMTLEVRNQKPLPLLSLEIEDSFPLSLPVSGGKVIVNRLTNRQELHSFWMPGALQRLSRNYTLHCSRRGYHTFGPTKVASGDGARLFKRSAMWKNEQYLIVYPRLYSAAELRLPAKNPFGERVSKQSLFEDPLRTAGIRAWQPGDGMRRVHWKATARHREMLSRLYEPSEAPQVLIFLNVATQERFWEGVLPELVERTISVAASLAAYCVEQRLPVGVLANAYWPGSDQTMRLLPGRSPDQLTRILELLAAIDLPNRAIETQLLREAPQLPWGATLLVVTAVAHPELLDALLRLRRAGRKVVLFTLAEAPPERLLPGVRVYHLPHLIADMVLPTLIAEED